MSLPTRAITHRLPTKGCLALYAAQHEHRERRPDEEEREVVGSRPPWGPRAPASSPATDRAPFPSDPWLLWVYSATTCARESLRRVVDVGLGGRRHGPVKTARENRPKLVKAANDKKSTAARRDVARAGLRSLDQEIKIAELRVQVRRMVNLCESPGCWRRADKDKTRRGETQAQKYARKDPNAVDPTKGGTLYLRNGGSPCATGGATGASARTGPRPARRARSARRSGEGASRTATRPWAGSSGFWIGTPRRTPRRRGLGARPVALDPGGAEK